MENNLCIDTLLLLLFKGLRRFFLPAFLVGLLVLVICSSGSSVEARYQLQERIGFEVTIPASPN